MKYEDTNLYGQQLVIDESGIAIAVKAYGEIIFKLNDIVHVTGDCCGYICPGITKPGIGRITEIQMDDTDHFFGVTMLGNGEFGFMKAARMNRCTEENTSIYNYKLVLNEQGTPIGVMVNGEIRFKLHDFVRVTGDCYGYICPGITKPGIGQITEIQMDDTDHFFGVTMLGNGEFGFMKSSRMELYG